MKWMRFEHIFTYVCLNIIVLSLRLVSFRFVIFVFRYPKEYSYWNFVPFLFTILVYIHSKHTFDMWIAAGDEFI